jgi:hypothetical protein
MDSAVHNRNASPTSRAAASAGVHGSAELTTKTASTQNSWPIVDPKQITEPRGRDCIDVGARPGLVS